MLGKSTNLEDHHLAVVSLQVEGPGGGDEALGGADDVIAPAGHGVHHRHGLGPVGHGLQLRGETRDNQHATEKTTNELTTKTLLTLTVVKFSETDLSIIIYLLLFNWVCGS